MSNDGLAKELNVLAEYIFFLVVSEAETSCFLFRVCSFYSNAERKELFYETIDMFMNNKFTGYYKLGKGGSNLNKECSLSFVFIHF